MERFEKIEHSGFYVYFVVVFSVLFFGLWLALKTVPVAVPESVPAVSPLPPDDLANFNKDQVQTHPQAQYIPDPVGEYQIFYILLKEKFSETKNPVEILSYVNDLKGVSVRLYLKYHLGSTKLNKIRVAVRKAVLKVFQEYNFYYYPNCRG